MVGKLGHIEQVVGDAAHDLADLRVVVVGVVEPQQVVKGVAAHVGLDVYAHDVPDAGHKVACRAVDDAQHKVERSQPQHGVHGQRGGGDGVRQCAHDGGQGDVAERRQRGAEQIKGQYAAVLGHIRQKTADQGAVFGARVGGSFGHGNLFRFDDFCMGNIAVGAGHARPAALRKTPACGRI